MFRPSLLPASDRRRAVILMVVLVLLTLFAVVGLAFVLYANAEADSSRVYREANSSNLFDENPDTLAGYGLGQFFFDVGDPYITNNNPYPTGAWSALRGHSVGRDIYGWNADYPQGNIYPFNGVGRLHTGQLAPNVFSYQNPYQVDDHNLLNYVPYGTYVNGQFLVTDQFVRDPERLGMRQGANALTLGAGPYTAGWNPAYTYPDGNHVFLGAVDASGNVLARSFHRPYLVPNSPITNSPYLPLDPNDPNYWSWYSDVNPNNPAEKIPPGLLKYYSLRPRNVDMATGFPLPGVGGDVKNLLGFPGPYDSTWIDLDYPVKVMPDGTKYKPLFAFLIVDLDDRINLNVAGNLRGIDPNTGARFHLSNQGWGKWEVNPAQLSQVAANQAEWPQLLLSSASAPKVPGRYGPDGQPSTQGTVAQSGRYPHVYAQADLDASNGGVATGPVALPGPIAPPTAFSCFPAFPAGYDNGTVPERTNHPMLYDPLTPRGDDRRFGAHNLIGLYNHGVLNVSATSTHVGQLLPNNMASSRVRNMVTTDSYHLDRPGLSPWLWDPYNTSANTNTYGYAAGANASRPPTGQPIAFPSLVLRTPNPTAGISGNVPAGSEFNVPGTPYYLPSPPAAKANTTPNPAIDWRSAIAAMGKIDLNRFLPPYPHQGRGIFPTAYDAQTNKFGYDPTPLTGPVNAKNPLGYDPDPNYRYDDPANPNTKVFPDPGNFPNANLIQYQFLQAQTARQKFADEIYRRLLLVTGTLPPANPAAPVPQDLAPRRWLAQLAVNIVDFVDDDDMVTPFNFYTTADGLPQPVNVGDLNNNPRTGALDPELPKYWVYGTELPKVLVNEVLSEYTLPGINAKGQLKNNGDFDVNVWVELVNALPSLGKNFPATVQPQDNVPVPLAMPAVGNLPAYAAYQVVLADSPAANNGLLKPPSPAPFNNDEVLGTPNEFRSVVGDADFGNPALTQTIDKKPAAAQIGTSAPGQFFLLGPGGDNHGTVAAQSKNGPGVVPAGTPMLTSPSMKYTVRTTVVDTTKWRFKGQAINDNKAGIGVLLRRLTNPHLPFDPNLMAGPGLNPNYNPYVTIDYVQSVKPQDTTQATTYYSTSKLQPYAANPTQVQTPAPVVPPKGQQPTTIDTFGTLNVPPGQPNASYDWLVHVDRQLINPMELLHVSGYHPHQLTHRFVTGTAAAPTKFTHRVNWFDPTNRLYRAFEFLSTPDRTNGVSPGGRVPGLVNINTVWDPEVFLALCDPQAANGFDAAAAKNVFNQMLASRSPGLTAAPGNRFITGKDRPFLSAGVGNMPPTSSQAMPVVADPQAMYDDGTQKPTPTGIEDTLLRSANGSGNAGARRLFELPGKPHIYAETELLTKIYGNVTNRSNVFAVWMTVGFFRVADDTVRPVKLAEEIGAANGTNIRHRIFSVIDRSRMTIGPPGLDSGLALTKPVLPTSPNKPVAVPVTALSGTTNGAAAGGTNIPWQLQPAFVQTQAAPFTLTGSAAAPTVAIIDAGTANEETVVLQPQPPPYWQPPPMVQPIPPNPAQIYWIVATFQKSHQGGATITIPGNPGPQPSFSVGSGSSSGLVIAYQVLQ